MFFHKYVESNVAVTNCMSHCSIFVPTKATVKLDNGNTGRAQGIRVVIFLSHFTYGGVIFYCLGHFPNTISLGSLKLYVSFQKVAYEPLGHCEFVDPQGRSWISPYQTQNNLYYLHIEIVKLNPQRDRNILVLTICDLSI